MIFSSNFESIVNPIAKHQEVFVASVQDEFCSVPGSTLPCYYVCINEYV